MVGLTAEVLFSAPAHFKAPVIEALFGDSDM